MHWIAIVILSLLCGLTGVLPLSDSAFFAMARDLMGLPMDGKADGFLQGMCLLAVAAAICLGCHRELRACFYRSGSRYASEEERLGGRQFLLLVCSFLFSIPGLVLSGQISFGGNLLAVACLTLVGAAVFFGSDRMAKGTRRVQSATLADAAVLGLGQSVAVIPGFSGIGLTFTLGVLRGLEPNYCLSFSLLSTIPVLLVRSIVLMVSSEVPVTGLSLYFGAMVLSGLVAYGSLRLLRFHVRRSTAGYFAFISLAAALLLAMLYLVS